MENAIHIIRKFEIFVCSVRQGLTWLTSDSLRNQGWQWAPDVPDVSAITSSLLQVTDPTQDLERVR